MHRRRPGHRPGRAAAGVLGDAALVFLLPLLLCFLGWLIASRLSPEPLWQAVGAAAVYAATCDQRQLRKNMRKMTRGAEKALHNVEQMIEQYTR